MTSDAFPWAQIRCPNCGALFVISVRAELDELVPPSGVVSGRYIPSHTHRCPKIAELQARLDDAVTSAVQRIAGNDDRPT